MASAFPGHQPATKCQNRTVQPKKIKTVTENTIHQRNNRFFDVLSVAIHDVLQPKSRFGLDDLSIIESPLILTPEG